MTASEKWLKPERFQVEANAGKAADLEHMIGEFERMAADLDQQIAREEQRTGVTDPAHSAYSTLAKSACRRRKSLRASIAELRAELAAARRESDEGQTTVERASPAGAEPK